MKKIYCIILVQVIFTQLGIAQTNVWLGNTAQWLNAANWSLGTFPTSSCSSDIEIPAAPAGGLFPIIGPSLSPFIGNLTIGDGAKITINLGLNICGNINAGSTTGSHFLGNGIVNLVGTTTQDINGKCSFRKVRSDNSSINGINLNGDVEVSTFWQMKDGDIWSNGSFTLMATPDSTAYMDFFTYPVGGIFTGLLTVQKHISNTADGYRDLCLPVSTTVSDLADDFAVTGQNGVNCWYAYSPYPTLQEYREDANADTSNYYGGFWSYTSGTNYFDFGKGYAARIYNAPLNLSVTGTMNYGFGLVSITHTPSSTPSADGWNLIGNPYPAPIKWSSLKALNAGKTDGSCYRFSTTGEYAGNWSAHNGVTGVPISTTDEISMFQGFFVLAPSSDFLFFDNSICTGGNSVVFYKTDQLSDELRLQITNGTNADEIVMYTDPSATAGYDAGQDAVKIPAGTKVSMSCVSAGKELAINVLGEITEQTVMPLIVKVSEEGSYTISPIAMNLSSLTPYLKDASNNTLYDLSAQSPTFSLIGGVNYDNRFSVVFMTNSASAITDTKDLGAKIFSKGKTVFVETEGNEPKYISITNLLGQKVVEQSSLVESTVLDVSTIHSGYIVVKVVEGSKICVKKLFINN